MSRFKILALAAVMALVLAAPAMATELKVSGEFRAMGEFSNNLDFVKGEDEAAAAGANEDDFHVQQRMRNYFSFVANENLKAVWGVEIGTNTWGNANGSGTSTVGKGTGFGVDGDGVNVETKHAYLDFTVPGSTVGMRAGLQPVALPATAAFGSSVILDIDAAALVVTTPINDMFAVTAGWSRLSDNTVNTNETTGRVFDDSDLLFLAVPITLDGVTATPFGAYATLGKDGAVTPTGNLYSTGDFTAADVDNATDAMWAGLALEVTAFDPFVVSFDLNYGSAKNDGADYERTGMMVDFALAYKGLSFGEPRLFAMWSSGEDDDTEESERMPYLINAWGPPGSFFYDGSALDSGDVLATNRGAMYMNQIGTWEVGVGLYGMSFVENLLHDIIVMYIAGTNDNSANTVTMLNNANGGSSAMGIYLTEEDTIIEVDFNTEYQMYEQLSAIVELGVMLPDFDEDAWGDQAEDTASAWRFLVGLKYRY